MNMMKTLIITLLVHVVLAAHLSGHMSSSQCTEGMIDGSVHLSKDLKDGMIQLNCTVSNLTDSVDFIFPNNTGYAYCIAPTSLTTETVQHCHCECKSTSTCECTISQNIDTKTTSLMIKDIELTDMSGMYTCQHGPCYQSIQVNNCHKTHLVRGIGDFPDVLLSGEIIEIKEYTKLKLTCFSCSIPFMKSVYFYINGKLEDNVRYSDGKCNHKRKPCSPTECTCTETGNDFTWIYISDLSYLEVACEMKFKIDKTPQLSKKTAVLVFNESEFKRKITSPRNITETEIITGTQDENEINSDDCQSNADMVYVAVSMLTIIVAVCIASLSFAFPYIPGRIIKLIPYCCYKVRNQTDDKWSLKKCTACYDISVCGICVDCQTFYCDSCCEFHLKEYTKHRVCQIQNVSNNREVLGCKKCSQLAKRFCQQCWELCCGVCAKSNKHGGHEMIVIYPAHNRIRRQISQNIPTQLIKIQSVCIDNDADTDPVRICGLDYLADGTIVAVDRMNCTLIIFCSNQKHLEEHLTDEPCAMTAMTGNEIAITFSHKKYIGIYKIYLTTTKIIDSKNEPNIIDKVSVADLLKLKPFSIAYSKGYFAVEVGEGEDGMILIIDICQKKVMKKIRCEFAYFTGHTIRLGLKIFSPINAIIDGRLFVSAMSKKMVSCLNFESEEQWHISDPSPRSIIVPDDDSLGDNIILSSRRSNTIYQLNQNNGNYQSLKVIDNLKINSPRYIAYHSTEKSLCALEVKTEQNKDGKYEDELVFYKFQDPEQNESSPLMQVNVDDTRV